MRAEVSVGVLIPAFNAESFLAEAIESVLGQTHTPVDILVLDDGSTDATSALAARYGPPVRVEHQANAGIGAARNRGVELVKGEVIAFLDSDDMLAPTSIECRLKVLLERAAIDLVFGHVSQFTHSRDGVPDRLGEPSSGHLPGAMLVRRAALERVGPFPTHTHVAEGLDWLLRARELSLGEATVEDVVMWRRVHGQNNSFRHRAQIGEFAHALKASLDRRRADAHAQGSSDEPRVG